MVFYFTGTGNSLYVAKQLDETRISIPQVIHLEELTFEEESIGVVCPVYGHEMPGMVKEFLQKARFKTDYFYLVLTYGNIHGGAAELAEQFLASCGKKADYINTVLMVDNFLPAFDMEEQLASEPGKKAEEHIAAIKADIDSRRKYRQPVTEKDRSWHRAVGRGIGRPAALPLPDHRGVHRLRRLHQGLSGGVYPSGKPNGGEHRGKLPGLYGLYPPLSRKRDPAYDTGEKSGRPVSQRAYPADRNRGGQRPGNHGQRAAHLLMKNLGGTLVHKHFT